MRKPVAVPMDDAAMNGTMRRRPDDVALSRSTAWKYNGMLNVMALAMMAPVKFAKIRPARGLRISRGRGMIGRVTMDSVYMNRGKPTPKMARDVITKG